MQQYFQQLVAAHRPGLTKHLDKLLTRDLDEILNDQYELEVEATIMKMDVAEAETVIRTIKLLKEQPPAKQKTNFTSIEELTSFYEKQFPGIANLRTQISKIATVDIAELMNDEDRMEAIQKVRFKGMQLSEIMELLQRIQFVQSYDPNDPANQDEPQELSNEAWDMDEDIPEFFTMQELIRFYVNAFPQNERIEKLIRRLVKDDLAALLQDGEELLIQANVMQMDVPDAVSIIVEVQKMLENPPNHYIERFTSLDELIEFYKHRFSTTKNAQKNIQRIIDNKETTEILEDEQQFKGIMLRFKDIMPKEIRLMLKRIQFIQSRQPEEQGPAINQPDQVTELDSERKALNVFLKIFSRMKIELKEQEVREKISTKDQRLRLELLRNVQDHKEKRVQDHIWKWMKEYSEKYNIGEGYLEPASFLRYKGKSRGVDSAVRLLFQGVSHTEIVNQTKVEQYLVEKLNSYQLLDQTKPLLSEIKQLYQHDVQVEIDSFLQSSKTEGFTKITIQELKVIDFLKRENIQELIENCQTEGEVIIEIRPLIVTYIQAALPLDEIYSTITKYRPKFKPTSQDLFDLILLESKMDARAVMLESYSQFYPVPLVLQDNMNEMPRMFFEIAYFLEPYKSILSFGLFKAHLMKCGKSTLIDELFCTKFTYNFQTSKSGKERKSIFDFGRINIQLPRNINSLRPETQWSVLDASRFTDTKVLTAFCKVVNVICIHILATDLIELQVETVAQQLKPFINESKQVVVFVRDINCLTPAHFKEYQEKVEFLKTEPAFAKVQFLLIKSREKETIEMLYEENQELADLYDSCSVVSTRSIKEILNQPNQSELFSSNSIICLYDEIWAGNEVENHPLKHDLREVDNFIQQINIILDKQINDALEGANQIQSNPNKAEIGEELITNNVLTQLSSYYKVQKYHKQVSRLLYQKDTNERNIEDLAKQQAANETLDVMIKDKNLKIDKWVKIFQQYDTCKIHQAFIRFLNHERSVLLIWLLTQRLHKESKTNPTWRRLLLNQDLFMKNLKEQTNIYQPKLDEVELLKLLDRYSPENVTAFKKVENELSIFDFFRQSIVQTYCFNKENAKQDNEASNQWLENIKTQRHGFKNYLISGESLELVDGENMRIHDEELTFFMEEYIDHLMAEANGKNINMYIITQIGKQSVGKSFLLNHVFKTKFLNKSGRCTSGINFALRDMDIGRKDKLKISNNEKLLILDTEGLGSLDQGDRLGGKELHFDRMMVLFSLTISNALIITLKTEVDQEKTDILKVCCWALSEINIDKNEPPHIFFVINQQADTNPDNYIKDFNKCVEEIINNELLIGKNIEKYIKISKDNLIILPNAFNQDDMNFKHIFDFPVHRLQMNHSFNEMCQDLGLKIINTIKGSNQNISKQYNQFLKIAGNSFRTLTTFPDLLRHKNIDEIKCEKLLREKVDNLLGKDEIKNDYQNINTDILKKVKSTDEEELNKKDDYIDFVSGPLTKRYQEHNQELKRNYEEFSQQQNFAKFPDIVQSNRQIMICQSKLEYQDYQNVIQDEVSRKKTTIKKTEFKEIVIEKLTVIKEQFMKSSQDKWEAIFKQQYHKAKQEYENQNKKKAFKPNIEFERMFKDQYKQFTLELKGYFRLRKNEILKEYILPINSQEDGTLYIADVINQVIQLLEKQIMKSFKTNKRNPQSTKRHLSFIKTNLSEKPPSLIDITGRDQNESKFIDLDCISQQIYVRETKDKYFGGKYNPGNWLYQEMQTNQYTVPHSSFPKEIKFIVNYLIQNKLEAQYTSDLTLEEQVIRLSQQCPAKGKNFEFKIWDEFIQRLKSKLDSQLSIVYKQKQQGNEESTFSHQIGLDTKCMRKVISIVNEMIEDIDFELRYIMCCTSTSAKTYLNLLGFFIFLQKKVEQLLEQENDQIEAENKYEKQFYQEYKQKLEFEKKFIYLGLSPQQMQENQIKNTKELAAKIIQSLEEEVQALTLNNLLATIQKFENEHLTNIKLVNEINKQVKEMVQNNAEPEAQNNDHLGVRYVIDFNGCIESQFNNNWNVLFTKAYALGKQIFKDEITDQINNLLEYFSCLQKTFESKVDYANLSQQNNQKGYQYFYATDRLFKPIIQGGVAQQQEEAKGDNGRNRNIDLFKIPVRYLRWIMTQCLDPDQIESTVLIDKNKVYQLLQFDGKFFEAIDSSNPPYPRFGQPQSKFGDFPKLSCCLFKRLEESDLFNQGNHQIFNLYNFVIQLQEEIKQYKFELSRENFTKMLSAKKSELLEKSKGCTERCPACNKLCEKPLNHQLMGGNASLHSCSQYGHQFFSMGGRAWENYNNNPILVQCHDKKLKNNKMITLLSGSKQEWGQFKINNKTWIWDDEDIEEKDFGLEFTIKLYNKCGRQILKFYNNQDPKVRINFRPFTDDDRDALFGIIPEKQVLFVVDGTGSMHIEINKAKQAILNFTRNSGYKEVGVVIYRSHDDSNLVEVFPSNHRFTTDMNSIGNFLIRVKAQGGSFHECMLDGLAQAQKFNWSAPGQKQHLVIHIGDIICCQNWPDWHNHNPRIGKQACCCCGGKCSYKWDKDVFEPFKTNQLQYHLLFTGPSNSEYFNIEYQKCMIKELGSDLCEPTRFQLSDKSLIEVKINEIVLMD